MTTHPLVRAIRLELARNADAAKAGPMRAYMKSEMPYRGVMAGPLRRITREIFAGHPLEGFAEWRTVVLDLWRNARFREERYAAIGLVSYKDYEEFRTLKALPMLEEMITTGAWWDYVDGIASSLLGGLLRRHPAEMKRRMLVWARSRDLWKRRSAILCQLGFKEETDLDLLYACIASTIDEREIFIRKAIGWALRQYAWTDPAEVVRFVESQGDRLSPLSRREALKNTGRGARRRS